jgi:hypothetical protein
VGMRYFHERKVLSPKSSLLRSLTQGLEIVCQS